MEREISPKLRAYVDGNSPDQTYYVCRSYRPWRTERTGRIHERGTQSADLCRAFDDMQVEGIENGQQELQSRHLRKRSHVSS